MPFEWRPQAELRKRYEEPLKMLESASIAQSTKRRRIYLDFSRDEEVEGLENEFEKIKNRKRSIAIGNCRLLDTKMEKAGTYEINPPSGATDKYFECDQPKGAAAGGTEQIVTFIFSPPQQDPMLQGIGALKGIGQFVESVWELKLIGGFVEPGCPDPLIVDIVLKAYVEQI